jgi:hypothetical protein
MVEGLKKVPTVGGFFHKGKTVKNPHLKGDFAKTANTFAVFIS